MNKNDYSILTGLKKNPSLLPRIAMVSTHGYVAAQPPLGALDTGGQVVYVIELSKKLSQLGYEVDIWTRRFEEQPAVEPVSERVRILRAPCGGSKFIPKEYLYRFLPEWVDNVSTVIEEFRLEYHFLVSHYWDAGFATQELSQKFHVPHLHTPHSLGLWKKKQMLDDFPGNEAEFEKKYNFEDRIRHETRLYNECNAVIATTPIQTELLIDEYRVPSGQLHMIPPGYDDNRFFPVSLATRESIRQRLGFQGKVIFALGRLALNKGYDLLIRGFEVCSKRVEQARLYLALGGESISEVEKELLEGLKRLVQELNLDDKVIFGSFIPENELADYYRAADLFVLSSRYEPFGMTAIEAMACGTPTVVTLHGGLYKVLTFGRHALFADPFDAQDLGITMMKALVYEKLCQRMSRMGAHKARSLFTWTGIAQQLIHIVEQKNTTKTLALEDSDWAEPWNDGD